MGLLQTIQRTARNLIAAAAFAIFVAGCSCGDKKGAADGAECVEGNQCASSVCLNRVCVPQPDQCKTAGACCSSSACVDVDCDGLGDGCTKGPDCNDNDPAQGGREICSPPDQKDNDCDGKIDEAASPVCGCDPQCTSGVVGPGTGTVFDPNKDPSNGLELDPNGYLVLKSTQTRFPYIWIVNTGAGTVSKFDTVNTKADGSYKEVGRYWTGGYKGRSTGPQSCSDCNDPSRTTINTIGDAYVGNRNTGSVTKFASDGTRCVDKNKNGMIETSFDKNNDGAISANEMLDWGKDECMLWNTQLTGSVLLRAMAAQDEYGPDGEVTSYVWAGSWNDKIWKLDGKTGAILINATPSPVHDYGFALDGNGQLWISSWEHARLGRLDTRRCTSNASCSAAACEGATAASDACVKQWIAVPGGLNTYGITVDKAQNVWLGGFGVFRYKPKAASRWDYVPRDNAAIGLDEGWVAGIAADGLGFVYGGAQSKGILRIEAATFPAAGSVVAIPNTSGSVYGMAIDADGKVWGIHKGDDFATVVTPTAKAGTEVQPRTFANTDFVVHPVTRADKRQSAVGLDFPYTYSDMTGVQLQLATGRFGSYQHTFEACPGGGSPHWEKLYWDAVTPTNTKVVWKVRTANDVQSLAKAAFVDVGSEPPSMSPADLKQILGEAADRSYIEVRVEFVVEQAAGTSVLTPTVKYFEATFSCSTAVI